MLSARCFFAPIFRLSPGPAPILPPRFQSRGGFFIFCRVFGPPFHILARPQGSDFLTPYLKKFCASEPAEVRARVRRTRAGGRVSFRACMRWRVCGRARFVGFWPLPPACCACELACVCARVWACSVWPAWCLVCGCALPGLCCLVCRMEPLRVRWPVCARAWWPPTVCRPAPRSHAPAWAQDRPEPPPRDGHAAGRHRGRYSMPVYHLAGPVLLPAIGRDSWPAGGVLCARSGVLVV